MLEEYIKKIDANSLNGSDLAYIGDAYYELYIRSYLLSLGYTKPEELHKLCINYVSAKSHAKIYETISEILTEKEKNVFNRGKNYNYKHHSRSTNVRDYLTSSGFEAVIGYLYVSGQNDRLNEILGLSLKIIEDRK